jgi:hypothetical protein
MSEMGMGNERLAIGDVRFPTTAEIRSGCPSPRSVGSEAYSGLPRRFQPIPDGQLAIAIPTVANGFTVTVPVTLVTHRRLAHSVLIRVGELAPHEASRDAHSTRKNPWLRWPRILLCSFGEGTCIQ